MDTALEILACLMPLVLAAIMIQTRRDSERAIAQLNERVHMLSRRCDVMQDTLDRYHAVLMGEEKRRATQKHLAMLAWPPDEPGMCTACDQVQPDSVAAICSSRGCPRRIAYNAGFRLPGSDAP